MRMFGRLFLACLLIVVATTVPLVAFGALWPIECRRVALVIGNGEYETMPKLPASGREAMEMGDALARLGFEVTYIQDADREVLLRGLVNFRHEADDTYVAVVYFSGHAGRLEGGRENYLIPVKAKREHEELPRSQGVPLDLVLWAVEPAFSLSLVIMEAPHSWSPGISTKNTLVAYAGNLGGGVLGPAGDLELSPYTLTLLRHLRMPDSDQSDLVTMFRRVSIDVAELTESRTEKQIPTLYGLLPDEGINLGCNL